MHVSIGPSEVKISPRTRAARHPDSKSVYAQRIAPSDFQIAPCPLDWCCMDSKSVYAENAPCHPPPSSFLGPTLLKWMAMPFVVPLVLRQSEAEFQSCIGVVVNRDVATMEENGVAHDGKTKSCSANICTVSGATFLCAIEALKQS